nr:ribonuclease H-like domain-containing protein [Tanacetum cinerariifolium]
SFDLLYGNYIELNDLDTPLEPETNQDVDFKPTVVNEPDSVKTSSKCFYKMKFSCTIGYKNVNADFIPSLSINLVTKIFYYSIIKDKDDHEGKSPVRALTNYLFSLEIYIVAAPSPYLPSVSEVGSFIGLFQALTHSNDIERDLEATSLIRGLVVPMSPPFQYIRILKHHHECYRASAYSVVRHHHVVPAANSGVSHFMDKDNHEGKSPAEALIDIPVFVGKFSILTSFIIIDDEDVVRDVVLDMPFFMNYVSCQMVMKKFAHRDKHSIRRIEPLWIRRMDVSGRYQSNSDFSSNTIISVKLTGTENYRVWVAAMKLAINTKNKTGFNDSTCIKSAYANSALPSNRCLNDVFQPIKSSLLFKKTLIDVKSAFAIVSREESHRGIAYSSTGSLLDLGKDNFATSMGDNSNSEGNVPTSFSLNTQRNFPENSSQVQHDLRKCSRSVKMLAKFNDYVVGSSRIYGLEKYVTYSKLNAFNLCLSTTLNKSSEPNTYHEVVQNLN